VLFRGQTTGTAVEVITRREPIPSLGRGGWLPDMQSCFAYSARGGHGGKLDEVPRCCERRRHAACFSSWPVSGRERENATCRCRHGARSGPSRRKLPCGDGCGQYHFVPILPHLRPASSRSPRIHSNGIAAHWVSCATREFSVKNRGQINQWRSLGWLRADYRPVSGHIFALRKLEGLAVGVLACCIECPRRGCQSRRRGARTGPWFPVPVAG
jgi:hypothetical protein